MATDQATSDYEAEQGKRERFQDESAIARSLLEDESKHDLDEQLPPVCAQCVNWQPPRPLYLADGTTTRRSGFCSVRAAADLPQMSQDYVQNCSFFEEEIPF